jgi:chaperonin cofactor prefoldin
MMEHIEHLERLVHLLIEYIITLSKPMRKIMTQLDDLTQALATLQADVTTQIAAVATEVSALQAQIAALQAANPGIDLGPLITQANAIDAAVKAATPAAPATPAP